MIPYDDLVAALATWRTRQGLPVVRTGNATPAAPSPVAPAPQRVVAAPAPAPRPAPPRAVQLPPPIESGLDDFDDGALLEDGSYDSGEDYVLSLGAAGDPNAEPTAIGGAPTPGRGKRGNDW